METPCSYWYLNPPNYTHLDAGSYHTVGIPHASTKDYVYDGYFIPAGSTIHALEWYLIHCHCIYD